MIFDRTFHVHFPLQMMRIICSCEAEIHSFNKTTQYYGTIIICTARGEKLKFGANKPDSNQVFLNFHKLPLDLADSCIFNTNHPESRGNKLHLVGRLGCEYVSWLYCLKQTGLQSMCGSDPLLWCVRTHHNLLQQRLRHLWLPLDQLPGLIHPLARYLLVQFQSYSSVLSPRPEPFHSALA